MRFFNDLPRTGPCLATPGLGSATELRDGNGGSSKMRLSVLAILGILGASVASADIIVGSPTSNNCIPFSCPNTFGITQYQQLYSATAFSGPVTITGLTFFNTVINNGNTTLAGGTFTLSLSTVGNAVGTFNSLIAEGGDATQIYSGPLGSVAFGDSFTLGGGSFGYNPGGGNLLLTVLIAGGSNSPGLVFPDADRTTLFSRAWDTGGETNYGLVTRFNTAVPEPSSVILFGSALMGSAFLLRKRLAAKPRA